MEMENAIYRRVSKYGGVEVPVDPPLGPTQRPQQ